MEIFSNIWNVLTSENEIITKIINTPTIFLEAWIGFLLFTSTLKIEYSNRQKYIYIILISASSLLIEYSIPSPFNIILNYIIMFLIIKIIFSLNMIKTVLSIFIPTIIIALIGILVLKPLLIIFKISIYTAQNTPIYQFIYLSLIYTISFFLIQIIQNRKIVLNIIDDLNFDTKKILLFNLLFTFFTITIQLCITAFYTDILPLMISILSFISLFAYFFINIYSLSKAINLQITSKNLENATNYNATLSYLYDNVKAFKHDFDNMVFIIGGYIQNNDLNGLKTYYKNFEKDCERVNELALLNPELINNSGIYNLLMSKYKKATDNNVEIHLEYFFDLTKLKMPIYDFSRILGILLDNALEAAKDSKEKQVNIMFRDSQRNNTQIISIENSYNNKDVDTSLIFEKGQTSKENHTGMGLWEVKQILNRNNNVNLITTKDKIYFKQTIEIYY